MTDPFAVLAQVDLRDDDEYGVYGLDGFALFVASKYMLPSMWTWRQKIAALIVCKQLTELPR